MNKNDRKKKQVAISKAEEISYSQHPLSSSGTAVAGASFSAVSCCPVLGSAKSGNSKTAKAQNMSASWIGEKHDMYIYYILLYILIFKTTHQTTYLAIPELTETRIPAQSFKFSLNFVEIRQSGGFHSHGGAPNHEFFLWFSMNHPVIGVPLWKSPYAMATQGHFEVGIHLSMEWHAPASRPPNHPTLLV